MKMHKTTTPTELKKVKLCYESDDNVSNSTMDSDLPLTKEEIEVFGLLSSDDENDDGSVQSADAS